MITIYVYTHDTMADWEIGHVTAELHSGRFFQAGRTGGIAQNGGHLQGAGHEHGRADDPAGLRGR